MNNMPSAAAEHVMLPASFAQELFWYTDRASPGSTAYNVPRTRRLRGPLNVDALRRAFDALVERHEILRTTYATHEDQVVQVIHGPSPVPFDVIDLSATPPEHREGEALRVVRERTARPFDLSADMLLRVTLMRLDDTDHVLLFESHHIAFDGWSRDVIFRELSAFYEAFVNSGTPDLPQLPIQYADFAIWQREYLAGERLETLLGWWRDELGDAERTLHLPTDFARPPVSQYEGVTRSILLPPATRDAIHQLGQRSDATLYMVLLAAYATVLHRYTGQPDVLVGSPIAGRARLETEGLIGYFANTIVQRARFADNPGFAQMLTRLRNSALGAYDHQDVPFERLVLEFEGRTTLGQSPLFQVVFTQLDSSQAPEARMANVTLSSMAIDSGTTKFDLTLFMSDRPAGLEIILRGRTDLFRPETVERFLEHMRVVLESAISNPDVPISSISLLDAAERAQVAAWNNTETAEGQAATLVELFEAQAARVPSRTAVSAGARALTYEALNTRANQLAHHLRALGVGPNVPVALALDRSTDALVGLIGILKAGGAYVPLPPDLPPARRVQQLRESGAAALVTNGLAGSDVPPGITAISLDDATTLGALPSVNAPSAVTPDSLAYVLFTSGSTGVPKGVAVTHANAVHYARAVSRVLSDIPASEPGDGFARLDGMHFGMVSTLGADLGNTCLLPSLLAGGTLHLLGKDVTTEPARFAEFVAKQRLDVLKITPNHLQALTAGKSGAELTAVLPTKWAVLGGEALRPAFARSLLGASACRVLNHYGPTETTVGVTTFEVTSNSLAEAESFGAQTVPIGRPLANTCAYVLDSAGNEQPIGIAGELWFSGAGVASGYFRRPDLTAERFAMIAGARAYRTGDRGRRLPDGTLEFRGRADDQVKVRGYRVELAEVEQVLRAHPGVAAGVVVLHAPDGPDAMLVAYAVPRAEGYAVSHADRPTAEKLTDWFATALPDYMVPVVVLLDALPLTPNGKVDVRALPDPDATRASREPSFVEPESGTQQKIAAIWAEVLKKERVGLTDNFLDLGGHSLMAIRILGKLSRAFGVRMPLRSLFDSPTVEALAASVDLELRLAALEAMSDDDAERLLDATAGETPK